MYEEISSAICKGIDDHCIDEAITRIEKGFDFDDTIEETIESIMTDHFEYLREHNYEYIRNNIIEIIENKISYE